VPAIQAKQYLRKIKRLDSFVKAKEEEISEIRNRLESLGCTDETCVEGNNIRILPNIFLS